MDIAEKKFKIHNKQTIHNGFFKVDHYRLQYKRYDGTWSQVIDREIFERGESAAVLLYDPRSEKVVLIEQFRIGAIHCQEQQEAWLLEIVAGMIEEDMTPERTIQAEVEQEAGLTFESATKIMEFYPSPGGSTEKMHLYCAKVDASKAKGFFGLSAENEDIRVIAMKASDAFEKIRNGKINNAVTIIALQWLQINQNALQMHEKK